MFTKAKDKRLYQEVVNQIRNLINTKQLKDGDKLPSEKKLSKSIGVSRATVREGLRVLELMGLVETKRGKGTFVRINGQESFRNKLSEIAKSIGKDSYYVYEIDLLLEPSVAKVVAERATEKDIKKIKSTLDKMERSIEVGGTGEEESLDFHKCIIDILENPFLDSIFELTKNIHKRDRELVFYLAERAKETLQEHYKIYEAIRDRNGNKAHYYMKKHLEKVGCAYNKLYGLIDENSEDK